MWENYALRHDKAAVPIRTLTTEKTRYRTENGWFYRYLLSYCAT